MNVIEYHLTKTELLLNEMGIKTIINENYRPFKDVLKDINIMWNNLNEKEQEEVCEAMDILKI